jgi:TonB family protein
MLTSSRLTTLVGGLLLLLFHISSIAQPIQQQSTLNSSLDEVTERGMRLYSSGDTAGAIDALRKAVRMRADNADAWHYLGLALSRKGDVKEARKAFEKAVKLRPDFASARVGFAYMLLRANKNREAEREARRALELGAKNAEAHYIIGAIRLREDQEARAVEEAEMALKVKPDFMAALYLKTQALVGLYVEEYDAAEAKHVVSMDLSDEQRKAAIESRRAAILALRPRLKTAVESLERLIALEQNSSQAASWREQLETLRAHAGGALDTVVTMNEVTEKAVILGKPDPGYPDGARIEGVKGVVRLRSILGADGKVRGILVLRSPDPRLTEAAMRAARNIKFKPALKDGQPISQFITLEYHFNFY